MLPGGVRAALHSPFKQPGDDTQRPLLTLPPRQLGTVVLINLQRLLTHTHTHIYTLWSVFGARQQNNRKKQTNFTKIQYDYILLHKQHGSNSQTQFTKHAYLDPHVYASCYCLILNLYSYIFKGPDQNNSKYTQTSPGKRFLHSILIAHT